MQVSSEEAFNS